MLATNPGDHCDARAERHRRPRSLPRKADGPSEEKRMGSEEKRISTQNVRRVHGAPPPPASPAPHAERDGNTTRHGRKPFGHRRAPLFFTGTRASASVPNIRARASVPNIRARASVPCTRTHASASPGRAGRIAPSGGIPARHAFSTPPPESSPRGREWRAPRKRFGSQFSRHVASASRKTGATALRQ
jgi:hypothetical protein